MSPEFEALRLLSARIGADPLLVQGAGGNTSIKEGGVLWIKASGKWLSEAAREDMFVPVSFEPLWAALKRDHPDAERAEKFIAPGHDSKGLRPSIETTVHALLPQKIVLHVHCVSTIAHAVQLSAEKLIAPLLRGIEYAFIPYRRPGLPLAKAIAERVKPETNVLVLGNHGLVVAAETVADAASLLKKVCLRLRLEARMAFEPDLSALAQHASGSSYRLPAAPRAHAAALDPRSCAMAAGGSLYPDHVVFLGAGSVISRPGESAKMIEDSAKAEGVSPPVSILFPGQGVLMRGDADRGAEAMAECLAEVTGRINLFAQISYLSLAENAELLNWDAEKYRQELNRRNAGAAS
jgi:rhamnose utilization protein RhaD (predicted bifunctional aldolase and dehydrogenase)